MAYFDNKLRALFDNPASFTTDPGYQFALDQGLQAVQRSNSAKRGSGNALLALQRTGQGLAAQQFGSRVDQFLRGSGQEQQYELGQGQNAAAAEANRLAAIRDANALSLGTEQNSINRLRTGNDFTLGNRNADITSLRNSQDFALGNYRAANEYELGKESNANNAQRNWWDYSLGRDRNNIDATAAQNTFNLGQQRLGVDWYNADTARGTARSNDFVNRQRLGRGL